ncbi:SLBB domain-containing protein [Alistipes sp.]|uniref:SLBB domain-containing protein n=1 Tax=Alistipes sp. TaxID=1872444 RepID=UPI0025C4B646|nr:SLBB domain-containing protein [Alistipes sp.]
MRRFFGFSALLLFLLAGSVPARAQMSDEAVVNYALTAKQAGKSDQQIGKELLAKGVTAEQAERLKKKYEASQGSETAVADQSIAGQRRERQQSSQETLTAGSMDVVSSTVSDPTEGATNPRTVFGRNIFRGSALTFEPNENQATPENYRLGPGDEIIIDIWGENERSLREEISPEGNIMIEQVGPVYLNGLTIREANEKLRSVFSQIYAGVSGEEPSSDVRVTLGRLRTIQVNVLGEVATPGTYRLSSFATVFHALYRAGGVTPIGGLRDIRIMRGDHEVARVDVYDLLMKGKQNDDIRLEEGDVIIVPPYELLVEISGNVKRPMHYEMKSGESLGKLMEYAGGFTGDAYRDEVRVIRESGREYQIYNVREPNYASWNLEDGDAVTVGSVLDRFANRVEVRGAVYREGMYELGDEVHTVRGLIERAEGLKGDAFPGRALLLREREDLTLEMVAVDLAGVMSGAAPDIELQRNDVLVIPSIHELEERGALTISGEVARPGTYPYAENMTIEDLVVQAGGLLDGASTARIDVSRRIKDPKSLTPSSELGKIYSFSLKDGLIVDGEPGFTLMPYDIVEVRRSPAYRPQERVTLDGEVVFSGGYTLIKKNERLSDLVKRAGGLTSDAYAHGARLIRRMNDEERAVRETTLRMALQNQESGDSLAVNKLQLSSYYTVGIELDKALAEPGSDYDMVLREGDRLVIPQYVSTVSISGEVMYPNTVLYLQGKNLKYYVGQAGGYGLRAKKSRAYVIYMNGTVTRVRSLRKARIEPGCQIIIPSKRERKGMNLPAIMSLATSAASIGTMAASIANLSK